MGVRPADVTEKRQVRRLGRSTSHCQRNPQDGVGAHRALVRRAVQGEHLGIDEPLFAGLEAEQYRTDFVKDRVNGLLNALAVVSLYVAVTALDRLEGSSRGAGGNRSASDRAVVKCDLDLNGGVATRIEDLARNYCLNTGHKTLLHIAG